MKSHGEGKTTQVISIEFVIQVRAEVHVQNSSKERSRVSDMHELKTRGVELESRSIDRQDSRDAGSD